MSSFRKTKSVKRKRRVPISNSPTEEPETQRLKPVPETLPSSISGSLNELVITSAIDDANYFDSTKDFLGQFDILAGKLEYIQSLIQSAKPYPQTATDTKVMETFHKKNTQPIIRNECLAQMLYLDKTLVEQMTSTSTDLATASMHPTQLPGYGMKYTRMDANSRRRSIDFSACRPDHMILTGALIKQIVPAITHELLVNFDICGISKITVQPVICIIDDVGTDITNGVYLYDVANKLMYSFSSIDDVLRIYLHLLTGLGIDLL